MRIEAFIEKRDEMEKICCYFGLGYDDAQDIIQSFFLNLLEAQEKFGSLEKFSYNGEPNRGYIFVSLRNKIFKLKAARKKEQKLSAKLPSQETSTDIETENCIFELRKAFDDSMKKLPKYNSKMFHAYYDLNHSIRSLAAATGISPTSVYVTISHAKRTIRQNLEPYRDNYNNQKQNT